MVSPLAVFVKKRQLHGDLYCCGITAEVLAVLSEIAWIGA